MYPSKFSCRGPHEYLNEGFPASGRSLRYIRIQPHLYLKTSRIMIKSAAHSNSLVVAGRRHRDADWPVCRRADKAAGVGAAE